MANAEAVVETAPAEVELTLDDLIGLFAGDQDSCGYAHPTLVAAICEEVKPLTLDALRRVLYPALASHDLDEKVDEIISWGFDRWRYRLAGTATNGRSSRTS